MKRQTQLRGERDWAGDDLVDLQAEPIKAIDAIFAPYPACILSGCNITSAGVNFDVAPGYVSLKGNDHGNNPVSLVAPFAGVTATTLPLYLTLSYEVISDVYGDGGVKPIAYDYRAVASTVRPVAVPYLEISTSAKSTFVDVIQTDAALMMTKAERNKLVGIADNANKYEHPDDENTRHVTDTEKGLWNPKNQENLATIVKNGYMSWGDKNFLEQFKKRSYTTCAGRIAVTDTAGTIPANLKTVLKGSFTAELKTGSDWQTYYYRITHNCNSNNLPNVGLELGVYQGQPLSVNVFNIQATYFDVAFTAFMSDSSSSFYGYPAAFNFTIEKF